MYNYNPVVPPYLPGKIRGTSSVGSGNVRATPYPNLAPFRGLLNGIVLGTALWFAGGILVWALT